MQTRDDLLICSACGTQFDVPASTPLKACRICDVSNTPHITPKHLKTKTPSHQDPRQFVPPTGQAWTSLAQMRRSKHHRNTFHQDPVEARMWSITTTPKFAIGQRCILLQTPAGNILWDCIAYLDQETYEFIRSRGGLKAIVISHPHYYTTHLDWARTFACPVLLAEEDAGWVSRRDFEGRRKLLGGVEEEVLEGVKAVKVGGHFPGSLVLWWDRKLFIADSLVTVPSALYHVDRPPGTTSFAFMWSIPNMIPLPPKELYKMWQALKPLDFASTHGAFVGTEVRDERVKERVLESMKIQAKGEGWEDVDILRETL
ncbi:Hypothetical predicted protein [Lecanosticta acicola]|uniref:Metallo-beta-lactamase domain-containing protein n=1 Tax=Lecanosticta acicola TaxID=111012 RepID=A0AAI8Z831_9PEZI|nr:Hypothetical predicted protein [Lecanosticta acicola]